jgi:hypothetical protein
MTEANPYLIDRLLAVQDQVLAAYAQLDPKAPEHATDLRQVLIEQFLRPLFSAHRRFTAGRITDAAGVLTEQLDLIIEHGFMPSFPLHDGASRLVLAEAVALVIEVADQPGNEDASLREVFSHIRQLLSLSYHFSRLKILLKFDHQRLQILFLVIIDWHQRILIFRYREKLLQLNHSYDVIFLIKINNFV